jgi:hypothetical protein
MLLGIVKIRVFRQSETIVLSFSPITLLAFTGFAVYYSQVGSQIIGKGEIEGVTTIAGQLSAEYDLTKLEKKKIIFLICSVLLFSVMNGTMFMIAVPDIA